MTSLKGDLRSIMGTPFGGVGHAVLIFSRVTRAAFNSDSVVLQLHDRIEMPEEADGKFRVDGLDPGPIRIELEGGTVHNHGWNIDLPDEGVWSLTDLVDAQVDWSPAVIGRAESAAREAREHADRAEAGADRVGTAEQVGVWASEASASATAAASAESGAITARNAAQSARDTAEGHANSAASSASNAAADTAVVLREEMKPVMQANAAYMGQSLGASQMAIDSATAAKSSENKAKSWAELSEVSATSVGDVETRVKASETSASESATSAASSESAARISADAAVQSENRARSSAAQAQNSESSAMQYADAAAESAQLADPEGFRAEITNQIDQYTQVIDGKADKVHTHTPEQVEGLDAVLARLDNIRAWFRGSGAPPASIPGARVGDWWLDTDAMELHEITEV